MKVYWGVCAALLVLVVSVFSEEEIEMISNHGSGETRVIRRPASLEHHSRVRRDVGTGMLTYEEKVKFVELHNKYRSEVNPTATDMKQMVSNSVTSSPM